MNFFKQLVAVGVVCVGVINAAPTPTNEWLFDDASNLSKASIGRALSFTGSVTATAGAKIGEGAAIFDLGAFASVEHGMGAAVNEYALLFDFKVSSLPSNYCSFFQTDITNGSDAELFLRRDGRLGRADLGGYNGAVKANEWYRLVVNVKNGSFFEIYIDGVLLSDASTQEVGGNYELKSKLLFFADNDGEDETIHISRLAMFDRSLTASEIASLGAAIHQSADLLNGPWLQNVTDTSIVVMWESSTPTASAVDFGTTTSYGSTSNSSVVASGGGTFIHKAVLSGLSPQTVYNYRVASAEAPGNSLFQTAPGDMISDFTIGIFGDTHTPIKIGSTMLNWLVSEAKIDLAWSTGDICSGSGNSYTDLLPNVIQQELVIVSSKVPLYVAMGNHDVGATWGGGDMIRRFFDQPKEFNSDSQGFKGSYVLYYGGVAAVFIDWNRMGEDVGDWLEEQFQSPAFQNARFRFSLIHNSPYYERWHINGESDPRASIVAAGVRDIYVDLLLKYNVNATFSGHMHAYERGQKQNDSGANTYFCVNGGGSYLEPQQLYDGDVDYDFITQGAHENSPKYFNYGVVNSVGTLEVKEDIATYRMHAFSREGEYYGVLDSFVVVDEKWSERQVTSISTSPQKISTQSSLLLRGSNLEIHSSSDAQLSLISVKGQIVHERSLGIGFHSVDTKGFALSAGIYFAKMTGVDGAVLVEKFSVR